MGQSGTTEPALNGRQYMILLTSLQNIFLVSMTINFSQILKLAAFALVPLYAGFGAQRGKEIHHGLFEPTQAHTGYGKPVRQN